MSSVATLSLHNNVGLTTTDASKEETKQHFSEGEPMSLDDNDTGRPLKLLSKEGREFTVQNHKHAIAQSNLVKTSMDTDSEASEVPLLGVSFETLAKIIEYIDHHQLAVAELIEKPLRSKIMKDVCKDPWDADFIDKLAENRKMLYDIILAANYLDMPPLLHLGCAKS
jgi:hypothetical protein